MTKMWWKPTPKHTFAPFFGGLCPFCYRFPSFSPEYLHFERFIYTLSDPIQCTKPVLRLYMRATTPATPAIGSI